MHSGTCCQTCAAREHMAVLLGAPADFVQESDSRTQSEVKHSNDARSLILYSIAARLGIGDALLLLIANRDSAEESRTTGFAGKQVALTVHQNGSLGCASGHGQYEGKDKYCSHKLKLNISASSVG